MSYKFDKAITYYEEKRLLELSVKALKIAVQLPESEFKEIGINDFKDSCSCDVDKYDLIYFITDDIAVTREKHDNLGDDYITRYSVYLKENWNVLMDGSIFDWYLISYIENCSSCSYVSFGDETLSYHKNDNYIVYSTNNSELELQYPFNKDDYFNYLMSTNLQQIPYEVLKELLDFEYPDGFHGNYFDF